MERRTFLGMMIGGVAAAAAVRTFPFRVFSFPSKVTVQDPLSLYGQPAFSLYWYPERVADRIADRIYGVTRYGVFKSGDGPDGWVRVSQELDIAVAKRLFPAPFRWQGARGHIHSSVLMADGSVVDA